MEVGQMTELELFARLIQCEAGGEGDNGMRAVASVVMNRVRTRVGEYGRYNTLRDVIFQTGQFNCARTVLGGQQNLQNVYNMNPQQIHYDIANWAIAGNRLPSLGFALWYFNPYSPNCRQNFPSKVGEFVIRIGDHCFYNPTDAYAQT
jgi:N-acetylmuramoyl-L-alanine amidase